MYAELQLDSWAQIRLVTLGLMKVGLGFGLGLQTLGLGQTLGLACLGLGLGLGLKCVLR